MRTRSKAKAKTAEAELETMHEAPAAEPTLEPVPEPAAPAPPRSMGEVLRSGSRAEQVELRDTVQAELSGLDVRINSIAEERRRLSRVAPKARGLAALDEARVTAVRRYQDAVATVRWASAQGGDLTLPESLPALRALAVDDGLWQDVREAVAQPAREHDAEPFGPDSTPRLAELDAEQVTIEERRRALRDVLRSLPRDVLREPTDDRKPTTYAKVG